MSFEYVDLKRIPHAMELSMTPACVGFDPSVLVWWLDATLEMYRRGNMRAVLDGPTQAFVDENRKVAEASLTALSTPGSLLLKSAIDAYESHRTSGMDKNLRLIAAASEHGKAVGLFPVTQKSIQYSVKKHRDDAAHRVMTVRSDVLNDFGFEGASLALNALRNAVGRDLDKKVSIWNLHEVFGGLGGSRPVAEYHSNQVFFLHTNLVEYICEKLSLAEVKEHLGVIKTLHDYFVTLETSL